MLKYFGYVLVIYSFIGLAFANYEIREVYPLAGKEISTYQQSRVLYMVYEPAFWNYSVMFKDYLLQYAEDNLLHPVDLYINSTFVASGYGRTYTYNNTTYIRVNITFTNDADAYYSNDVFYLPLNDHNIYVFRLQGYDQYYYAVRFTNTSLPLFSILPQNLSWFYVFDENTTKEFVLYLDTLPLDAYLGAYALYPYAVWQIDGNPYLYNICSLETCSYANIFYLDISAIDITDSFFLLEVSVLTTTPYEWINITYLYYLDAYPPQLLAYISNPEDGKYVEAQENISFYVVSASDLDPFNNACLYELYERTGSSWALREAQYKSIEDCFYFFADNLKQTDYILNLTLYDFARNAITYTFYYNRANNILDCYFNATSDMWCYYKLSPSNTMYLDYEKRSNISYNESINVYLALRNNVEGINAVVINNIDRNISWVDGCLNFKFYWINKTLYCTNNITFLKIFAQPNVSLVPFNTSFNTYYQDTSKQSEMFGKTYITANITLQDLSHYYNVLQSAFYDVAYDFYSLLRTLLPNYEPYENFKGVIDIDGQKTIQVRLSSTNRIYAIYEGDYYIKDQNISLNDKVEVYLNNKVFNKDPIPYNNVKAKFPMKQSSVFNSSTCLFISPQYIDVEANAQKLVEVKYLCNIFNTTTKKIKTNVDEDTYKVSYRIEYLMPNHPAFRNKMLYYALPLNDLESFEKKTALAVYLNSLANPLNYTIKDNLLTIYAPSSQTTYGKNTIYLDYWYDIVIEEDKEEEQDEQPMLKPKEKKEEGEKYKEEDKVEKKEEKKESKKEERPPKSNINVSINAKKNNATLSNATLQKEKSKVKNNITGNVIAQITQSKSLKVLAIIVLILVMISIFIKRRSRTPMPSRMSYLKSLKKEVL